MEKKKIAQFKSNPNPIDYIVFIACHSATVDDFSFGSSVRHVATFPFETVLASHLGMPTIRYSNREIYDWMCGIYIPQIIDVITRRDDVYTGKAIFQDGELFDSIFTKGSPKKIRFAGETTADLNLFMPDSDAQHSSDPDGIFVFNLDATSTETNRCKDIAPEILKSVPTPDGNGNRYQPVKLSTLFSVLSEYFTTNPEYNQKRIVIMLGSCRSVPDSFYRALQSTSGSSGQSDSEGGRNTRRSRRIKKTRRRGAMSRRNIRNRTSRRRK